MRLPEQIDFADMFGGVGGFRHGLEAASTRFNAQYYWDVNEYAVKSYNAIFGEDHDTTDVAELDADRLKQFDLLCAGFPCQSFSIAGRREGFDDTRGTLFFEIARVARAVQPAVLLLENVKGLLSHDDGETFKVILETLGELGYSVEWQVLNSRYHGVPQNRERVFIVGHLGGFPGQQVFPLYGADPAPAREDGVGVSTKRGGGLQQRDVSTAVDANYWKGIDNHRARTAILRWQNSREGLVADEEAPSLRSSRGGGVRKIPYILQNPRGDNEGGEHEMAPTVNASRYEQNNFVREKVEPVYTPDFKEKDCNKKDRIGSETGDMFTVDGTSIHGIAEWRTALLHSRGFEAKDEPVSHAVKGGGGGSSKNFATDGARIRKLTPRECWRLQGFPDTSFEKAAEVNSDTQLYKQAGNAVTVNVIRDIAERILEVYE